MILQKQTALQQAGISLVNEGFTLKINEFPFNGLIKPVVGLIGLMEEFTGFPKEKRVSFVRKSGNSFTR